MNSVLPVCRSNFSLLWGVASPEQLIKTATAYGYTSLMLADRENLYGCYDFYYAAGEYGLKPIIAVEIDTEAGPLILICENHEGFKNLSRIITHARLHNKPDIALLNGKSKNVICLTGDTAELVVLREIYSDRLYFKIGCAQPTRACRVADEYNIKPVASPSVNFLNRDDFDCHRLLRAIDGGFLLSNLSPQATVTETDFLREPQWYDNFYRDFPKAKNHSHEIIERCRLHLPEKKNILPEIKIEGGHFEKLRDDCLTGLQRRQAKASGHYLSRLDYELNVIRRTGFVDYFLIVAEIVSFCRYKGITAAGRGSAAGSLVSYGLGITEVDPVRENLYFERFLNEARSDCPDVDLDIDWRRRDDVLDYIYRKYGEKHVAMMASYTRFRPRLAIRETARAFGYAPKEIDKFIKHLSGHPLDRYDFPDLAGSMKHERERFMPVLNAARSLSQLPRHLGIHPGGIVITPQPITDYIPLERATKGIVVTQCDMYQAAKIGLVKIDILGQRGLAVIADCKRLVGEKNGEAFEVPENDEETYKLLRSGKTIGVFQIESPGLRALLKDLKPRQLNDITLALSLIRPGASESGMKKIFLNRFHGREKIVYPHQRLEKILGETHGVFIYQEQVILAARAIGGFNLPASDLLRRAITKKGKRTDREKLKHRFFDGARKLDVGNKTTQNIFSQLVQFAKFGFCKAHAATYGHLAYQSAYFKTHYPDIFMTAVLRNDGGYYPAAVYVAEARRLGLKVRPPDVNHSQPDDSLQSGRICLGLNRVRDLTTDTIEQIRNFQPFGSPDEFFLKIRLSGREMENLIKVGYFDSLETSRPKLLWQYRLLRGKHRGGKNDLFGGGILSPKLKRMPELVAFSRFEIFKYEEDILELSASFHPLTLFDNYRKLDLEHLYRKKNGDRVVVSGWLANRKRIKTRSKKSMVFLTFDAPDDTFEVVLFPDIYSRFRSIVRSRRYLTVEGYINIEEGNTTIIAQNIYPEKTGLKEAPYI